MLVIVILGGCGGLEMTDLGFFHFTRLLRT